MKLTGHRGHPAPTPRAAQDPAQLGRLGPMGESQLQAYTATFAAGEGTREYVVVGASLLEAAEAAQAAAGSRGTQVMVLRGLKRLGAVLGPGPSGQRAAPEFRSAHDLEVAEATEPAPETIEPPRPARRAATRTEQLVAFLDGVGGRAHVSDIAQGLGTSAPNAHNIVYSSLKKGRVERAGSSTGVIQLVGHVGEEEPKRKARKPRREWGGRVVRAHQAVDALKKLGGHAHTRRIAHEMGVSVAIAASAIQAAKRQGLLERVGRTGQVVLPGQVAPEPEPKPKPPPKPRDTSKAKARLAARAEEARVARRARRAADRAAKLSGDAAEVPEEAPQLVAERPTSPKKPRKTSAQLVLRSRVYRTLKELGTPCSAKEIAEQLGCRPREAGNAAVVLVEAGLARRVGEDKPAHYQLAAQS